MNGFALFIRHRTKPGKREEVRKIWERHMRPNIDANKAHEAYFYCFDNTQPDSIHVYQQYRDEEASRAFLETPAYADYLREVEPLLVGQPEVVTATPVWIKGG